MLDTSFSSLFLVALPSVVVAVEATVAGEILGRLAPAAAIHSVLAVQRLKNTMTEIRRAEFPGEWDAASGQFAVRGLRGGVYDLVLRTDKGTIEGADLRVEGDGPEALTETDREALHSIIRKMDEFMNRKNILFVMGTQRRAKVLMDLCRDRVHHMGDDLIWRVEIWQFENQYGAWQLSGQGLRGRTVLHREKAPQAVLEARRYLFEPRLGGILVAEDQPVTLPEYHVPDDWQTHPGSSPVRIPSEREAS
ncbi:MAG: hypothetical protein HYU36_20805 [Planctomycetes bacterium]|nr:hypothetical protein [Planctomycetota bacterium]